MICADVLGDACLHAARAIDAMAVRAAGVYAGPVGRGGASDGPRGLAGDCGGGDGTWRLSGDRSGTLGLDNRRRCAVV